MREPSSPRWLHVRCLRAGCGHDARLDAVAVFGPEEGWPAAGLSRRFLCRCGGRAAHLGYGSRRPRPDNPCGWL